MLAGPTTPYPRGAMIPAPISPQPNQTFLSSTEAGSSDAEDQVFSTDEAAGENLFEDMLSLISLLGSPNEVADPVVSNESTDLVQATAVDEVPVQTVATSTSLTEMAHGEVGSPTTGETLNPTSELVNEIVAATNGLVDDYTPTVAESNPGEASVAGKSLDSPTIPVSIESPEVSPAEAKPADPQLIPAAQPTATANVKPTKFDADELVGEQELMSEVSVEEEFPETQPTKSGEQQSNQPQDDSTPTAQLPIEADIVAAIEHRVSQAASSQDANAPTNTVDTSTPTIAASTVSQPIASAPNEIAEPIKVPITEQVATHLTSARIIRGVDKQEVTITLDPPRLGTISLEIVENNDGLTARVTAAEPIALQTLQSNLSSLLDSLEQAGIESEHTCPDLGHAGIGLGHTYNNFTHTCTVVEVWDRLLVPTSTAMGLNAIFVAPRSRVIAPRCRVIALRCRVIAPRCRVIAPRCRVIAYGLLPEHL